MTPDERMINAEQTVQYQEARIALLEGIAERQLALLEQFQRDFAMTRDLWTRLAYRHGWLPEEPPYWDDVDG